MKQKEIVITDKLSLDAEQLIYEYFAVKRIEKIEGFIVSEEEFLNRHQEMMQAWLFRSDGATCFGQTVPL